MLSNDALKKRIGANVKHYRLHAGLTQEKLSERVGMSQGYITRIETGVNLPNLYTLYQISLELRVTLQDLVR